MKKIITLIVLTITAVSVFANDVRRLADDDTRQALYGALNNAADSLKQAPFGKEPIAILPLKTYHSALAGRIKNMLSQNGFVCIEGKEDPMWNEILKEIEWDERKSDILDPETVVKFGKLKAAKILFQCEVRLVDKNKERIYAEIELRATDIATKQIVWGGTFASRYYTDKDVQGIISLDDDLREILKKSFEKTYLKLTTPQVAGKLNKLKNITIIPINGDIDSYLTQQAIAMLTQTHILPQKPAIPSLAQLRATARDGLLKTDAIFYGSIRALHKTRPETTLVKNKAVTTYYVIAEFQLFIENANGDILWGDTISLKEPKVSERNLTIEERTQLFEQESKEREFQRKRKEEERRIQQEERKEKRRIQQEEKEEERRIQQEEREEKRKIRDEKVNSISDEIAEDAVDNWKHYLKIIGIILGSLIGLGLIVIAIKAIISYKNVR